MFSEMSDRERQILYVKSKKLKQYIKKLKKTIYKNIIKLTDIRTNYSYVWGKVRWEGNNRWGIKRYKLLCIK